MQAQKFNGTVYVSKYKEDIKSMNGSLKNDSSAKKDWGWEDREKNKKKDKKCPHLPGTL
ncbi:MAG: hypothetical protein GX764_07990, partial [Firmicutes bacterium]|nr:hypothetical protein [Bacillota bacterium]